MPVGFSVVVPLHNEGTNVVRVLREIPASLEANPHVQSWELICVNDGSTDATAERLAEVVDDRVVVVTLPERRGQSAALAHGFWAARGDVIGRIDGDLQTTPDDFGPLLALLTTQGWDAVHGVRQARCDPALRRWSSRVANAVRRLVLHDTFDDIGCPLTVFRRECLEGLMLFTSFHRYLPYLMEVAGYRVTQMPVRHFPRTADAPKYGVVDRVGVGITSLLAVRWLTRHAIARRRPRD